MSAKSHHAKLLTTSEVAPKLGVCERTVRRYIDTNVLEAVFLPSGHARVSPAAVEACQRNARERREQRRLGRRSGSPKPSGGSGARKDEAGEAKPARRRRRKLLTAEALHETGPLDFSPEALSRLRAQYAA